MQLSRRGPMLLFIPVIFFLIILFYQQNYVSNELLQSVKYKSSIITAQKFRIVSNKYSSVKIFLFENI